MGLLIATICVGVLVLIGTIFGAFYAYSETDNKASFLLPLLTLITPAILLFGCFTKVSANEVGIIYHDHQGVLETVKHEGFQTKSIFEHITTISTTNKTSKLTTTGQTSDGQYATFEISLTYRVKPDDAGKFYKVTSEKTMPKDHLDTLVKTCLQSSTIKYDIFELLSEELETARLDFQTDLSEQLYAKYFVTLVNASFDDIDAGDDVEKILQDKAEAQQKIEIAEKEAAAKLKTAEAQKAIATAEAEAMKVKAEADALITKTLADAEAYKIEKETGAYTEKITNMITSYQAATNSSYEEAAKTILEIIFYDKWDGKLPEVLTSDSLSSLIGGLLAQSTSNNDVNP